MKTLPRNNFYKIISCIYNQVLNWMRCLYGFFFVNNYKCEICNNKYCSKYTNETKITVNNLLIF